MRSQRGVHQSQDHRQERLRGANLDSHVDEIPVWYNLADERHLPALLRACCCCCCWCYCYCKVAVDCRCAQFEIAGVAERASVWACERVSERMSEWTMFNVCSNRIKSSSMLVAQRIFFLLLLTDRLTDRRACSPSASCTYNVQRQS